MYNASAVRTWDLDLLAVHKWINANGMLELSNISVWKNESGSLFAESRGGCDFDEPVIAKFVSVTESTRPDIFPLNEDETQMAVVSQISEEHSNCVKRKDATAVTEVFQEENAETPMSEVLNRTAHVKDVVTQSKNEKRKKHKGLQPGKKDLLCLLDKDMVSDILQRGNHSDSTPDIDGEELSNVLLDPRCELLFDIHAHLIYSNEAKWHKKTLADIYPALLTCGKSLMLDCTLTELKTICRVIEHHTKRSWFVSGALKSVNVNTIVRAFGSNETVSEESSRRGNILNVFSAEKLSTLAHNYVKWGSYERIKLTVALGSVVIPYEHRKWLERATLLLHADVPNGEKSVELFLYPERNETTGELLFRTFDYMHILTNMRSHILMRGYEFCKKEAFEHLVDNSEILS